MNSLEHVTEKSDAPIVQIARVSCWLWKNITDSHEIIVVVNTAKMLNHENDLRYSYQ